MTDSKLLLVWAVSLSVLLCLADAHPVDSNPNPISQSGSFLQRLRRSVLRIPDWFSVSATVPDSNVNADSLVTAVTFGAGHIRTYDGKTYTFPGFKTEECSYVLTRDHVARNFTLLTSSRSVTLLTPDIAVTIDNTHRVKINNSVAYSDVPVSSYRGTVRVTLQGGTMVVETAYGISVLCRRPMSSGAAGEEGGPRCLVQLDSRYRSQAVGLLGTNDGNPSNDLQIRNGEVTENVNAFVNSYEVSGFRSCQHDTAPRVEPFPARGAGAAAPPPEAPPSPRCHLYFSPNSTPLRTCFSVIDPEPFKIACEEDSSATCSDSAQDASVCDIAAAYVSLCRARGVSLEHPKPCGSCGRRQVDTTWTVSSTNKLDVILILSLEQPPSSITSTSTHTSTSTSTHTSTSTSIPTHHLEALVHKLKHSLKKSGHVDVRFGLITFGCMGSSSSRTTTTHAHTFKGDLFSVHHFASHLREKLQHVVPCTSDRVPDATRAIQMASAFPFREDASRFAMLITHSEIQDRSTRQLLQSHLEQQDIVFSVATSDSTQQQQQSQGLYHRLALTTGGARYSSDVIRSMTSSSARAHHVTQHIAQTLLTSSRTTQCRQCVCRQASDGSGYSQCRTHSCP